MPMVALFVLFLLPPTVQLEDVSQRSDLSLTQHNNSCKQLVHNFLVLVLLCSGILQVYFNWEFLIPRILLLRILFRHLHEILTTGSMPSPVGTASRFRVVIRLTRALLCHTRLPTVDSLFLKSTARHFSHCGFLQTSLLGSDRHWEYHSRDKVE